MKVAVLRYRAGNVESVKNALKRLSIKPVLTNDAEVLQSADRVIFPGVGEASTAMKYLREKNLVQVIKSLTQPVLGICLGMQLLCGFSDENNAECLGVLPYKVRKFESENLKIPHTGWNNIFGLKGRLFEGVAENSYLYFVHSFYVEKGAQTTAACNYEKDFSAAIEYKNFYATQFHPEKSGASGAQVLENFLKI